MAPLSSPCSRRPNRQWSRRCHMHKAMLLLNAFPVGKMDFGAAVLNDGQRSPDQVHHILPLETLTNTLREMWTRTRMYPYVALRGPTYRENSHANHTWHQSSHQIACFKASEAPPAWVRFPSPAPLRLST